jgi:MFS family permease
VLSAGNGLCGSAERSKYLIWYRALTGIGSAALLQGSTSLLELVVTPSDTEGSLTDYIKLVESAYGFALAIGPMLGGVITDQLNWRWCFWV